MPARRGRRIGPRRLAVAILVLAVLGLNGVAWMQAWTMTHYTASGARTPPPEALSWPARAWTVLTGVSIPRPQNTQTPADLGLAYEVRRIALPTGETLEAWWVPQPTVRGVVLLFPAYATSKESLLAPAAAFHTQGYSTLLVDFRGAGGSSGSDTTLGAREGQDVAAAARYARLAWPGRPLVLYGISMGAAAVLHAVAQEGVQPAALILESPYDRLLDTARNRFASMGLPAFPGAELIVFWGSVQHGFDGFGLNPVDYAPTVTCPTLLLHGEQDPRVTVAQNAAIYARLGGRKQLVSFLGAGHELLIAAAPDHWQRSVAGFLAGIAPGAQP